MTPKLNWLLGGTDAALWWSGAGVTPASGLKMQARSLRLQRLVY